MKGYLYRIGLAVLIALPLIVTDPRPAQACCVCYDVVEPRSRIEWFDDPGRDTVDVVTTAIHNEINAHETWLVSVFLEDNILPAMQLMAEQLTLVALQQVQIIGSFFDAKHQLETQRILQKFQAEAHKDYHPSIGMCEFGTAVKSLAASERRGEYNTVLMAQRSLDRQLLNANSSGNVDLESRLDQFKKTYCNPYDNNNGLWSLCYNSPPGGATLPSQEARLRFNKDIDFARTVDYPWTLNVNFTDGGASTPDEQDVFALANNLFAHESFTRIDPQLLMTPADMAGDQGWGPGVETFMDMRSVVAKRAVAENSFNALVGMKSAGTGGSTAYLREILKQLGVEDAQQLTELLGENPSYHAQMEVLTKKIFQNPQFFTNLYDKPANVLRKDAALQAIGLMQKFDMFKSHLRSEASLSVLLETAVMELQTEYEGILSGQTQ